MKDKISELLHNELCIFCNNCEFGFISEDESIEKYGYYGCENCHRYDMRWEISKEYSDKLAEKNFKNN